VSTATSTRTISLPSGDRIPVLGQGTWHMGERPGRRDGEVAALRLGIELGMTLIDTAEMYGGGAAESLVGEAIAGRRDDVFLVSKVLPMHATRRGTIAACEGSLRRLGTDHLDLYLLHWRGTVPLIETVDAFGALVRMGWIRHWGVSNFDLDDLAELMRLPGGDAVEADQVLYNLEHRGIEYDLLPWARGAGLPIVAYSPIGQGRLVRRPVVERIAAAHGATPSQVALAWVLRDDGVNAIPKAGTREHVIANRAALDLELGAADLAALDDAFPPPASKVPLAVI
jgi:diketogulonate reductase-like aldo/keto reductase